MRMFKLKGLMSLLAIVTVCVFHVPPTAAVDIESLEGQGRVSVFGTLQNLIPDSGDSATTFFTGGSLGYFFTDTLDVDLAVVVFNISSGDDDTTIYNLLGRLSYNFYPEGWTIVPFAGVQFGLSGADFDGDNETGVSFGVQGGSRFFLTEHISVDVVGDYLRTTAGENANVLTLSLALSYYFNLK